MSLFVYGRQTADVLIKLEKPAILGNTNVN